MFDDGVIRKREDIPVEEAAAQARKHQSVQPTVAKEVSLN